MCIRDSLRPEHKTFAMAGGQGGRHWSQFRETCDGLRRYVSAHPGASIREIIDNITHHYGRAESARASLLHWASKGVIDGVVTERAGGKIRFYPREGDQLEPCDSCAELSKLRRPDGHARFCAKCLATFGQRAESS
jgi:hypothetical protein